MREEEAESVWQKGINENTWTYSESSEWRNRYNKDQHKIIQESNVINVININTLARRIINI